MKTEVVALAVGFSLALSVCADQDALVNGDFKISDGMGSLQGWAPFNWSGSRIAGTTKGNGVLRVESFNERRGFYRQGPISLLPKGKYRFSAEVRGCLKDGAAFGFLCSNAGWTKDVKVPFPKNTRGGWQEVVWEGNIPDSRDATQFFAAFYGAGTTNGEPASVEIRNLSFKPLTPEGVAATKGALLKDCKPLLARIVPIDPLLSNVRAKDAKLTCYWPAEPSCGVQNCQLSGTLYHNGIAGKTAKAKFGSDGRATLKYGVIGKGCKYRLQLSVTAPDGSVLATNAYHLVGAGEPAVGPAGKRLNNFVTELVNQPLKDGEVKFFRAGDGWVWISFEETADSALGYLDDNVVAVVKKRPDERYLETMRLVRDGWHVLKVRGAKGGRLRIHAVKELMHPVYALRGGPCDFSKRLYKYSFPFVRRFLLDGMNTASMITQFLGDHFDPTIPFYMERGARPIAGASIHFWFPKRDDRGAIYAKLTNSPWKDGWDCTVDENKIAESRANHIEMAEALWRMVDERPDQEISTFWGDATSFWYDDPKGLTAELSAVLNSGRGRGLVLPEVYAPARSTPEEVDEWVTLFAKQVESLGELVPGGKDHTLLHLSPYINLGVWSDEPCPETDIKVHYSRLLRTFATSPKFAQTAGLGTGAAMSCEEEMRRWIVRCFRYYGIEGGTEDLAAKYGYRWNPGFVKNPDFDEGLANWTAEPAVGGSVKSDMIVKYGTGVQHRMKVKRGTGDHFAELTASVAGANRLKQKLTGLRPGSFYSLKFCVVNRKNAEKRSEKAPLVTFAARLEGAEEVKGLSYVHVTESAAIADTRANESVYLNMYRYVFRANSSEATLVFEDRSADGRTVEPGTRQIVNYVVFRPYYCETPEEPQEIAELLGFVK